jgi:hypothetical protein
LPTERFDSEAPPYAPDLISNDAESERNSLDERLHAGSAMTSQGPVTGGRSITDDDSPPPTHFVEIKLPPVASDMAERPALPEESIAETPATPSPQFQPAAASTPNPAPPPAPVLTTPRNVSPGISLELPPDSNLVLVETVHKSAEPPIPEDAEGARPRRMRPPRVEIAEGPLQLVETAHKDSTPPGA